MGDNKTRDVNPMHQIADWYYDLNCGDWPEALGEQPEWFIPGKEMVGVELPDRYKAVLAGLMAICGHKETLRAHFKRNKMGLEESFDDWYDRTFKGRSNNWKI